jgi:carbamoyltransferase
MDYLMLGCFLLDKKEQKPLEKDIKWQEVFELD